MNLKDRLPQGKNVSVQIRNPGNLTDAMQHRAFGQALQELTRITSVDILKGTRSDAGRVLKDTGGIHESVKRLAYTLRKEVKLMPIILTIHVFGLTVTVRIKRNSNNRHSAK